MGIKDAAKQEFNTVIPAVGAIWLALLIDWVLGNLTIKKGRLLADDDAFDILNGFTADYLQMITQVEAYRLAVNNLVVELQKTNRLIIDYQTAANGIKDVAKIVNSAGKFATEVISDALLNNGLNNSVVQPVLDKLIEQVSVEAPVSEAKAELGKIITGTEDKPGKAGKYLVTTADDAAHGYTGHINRKLMEAHDYPVIIMAGSIIKTSSPQCRYVAEKLHNVFTEKNWDTVLKPLAEKNGMIPGTTFKNIPQKTFHYGPINGGCRHEFTPAKLRKGDKLSSTWMWDGEKIVVINKAA